MVEESVLITGNDWQDLEMSHVPKLLFPSLREVREGMGFSIAELARRTSVTRPTIRKLENGYAVRRVDVIRLKEDLVKLSKRRLAFYVNNKLSLVEFDSSSNINMTIDQILEDLESVYHRSFKEHEEIDPSRIRSLTSITVNIRHRLKRLNPLKYDEGYT